MKLHFSWYVDYRTSLDMEMPISSLNFRKILNDFFPLLFCSSTDSDSESKIVKGLIQGKEVIRIMYNNS